MKVYLVVFSGHYLPGQVIVVDDTERKAYNQVKKALKEMGLLEKNPDLNIKDLVEIQTDVRSIEVIDDGDY